MPQWCSAQPMGRAKSVGPGEASVCPCMAAATLAMGKPPAQVAWGLLSERQNRSIHRAPDLSSVPHSAPISTCAPPGK